MSETKPTDSKKQPPADIITPITVAVGKDKDALNDAQASQPLNLKTVGLSLLVVILGGLLLLSYASRNPVQPEHDTKNQAPPKAVKQLSPEVPPTQQKEPAPAMDPEQQAAQTKLAQNMKTVQKLLASGKEHEQNSRLSLAHTDYQAALRLDPDSVQAREAFARVQQQVAAAGFQQQMSAGFTALYAKKYNQAQTRFLKAGKLKPDSAEVRDALAQVDAAIRIDRIETLRKKALAQETAEQWQQAQETFQEVLKLDGAIRFAIQGSDRAQQMLRLEKRMAYYLKQPEVLSTDSYLDKALQLISEAQAVTPRGTRLQEQLQQLLLLVTAARTPVAVVVDSDGRTEVSIYRVGKLGRFTRRELQLRPGTYTVVGVRDGFQDVRRQVPVMAGRGPVRISITCTDKI